MYGWIPAVARPIRRKRAHETNQIHYRKAGTANASPAASMLE